MVVYILYGGGGPPGPKNARADFLSQSSRGLHGGPETRGPGTRTGSGLYLKWSVGSWSGPNLLLRVPGLFNFVCNTRVDRRTPHPRVISVSQHAFVTCSL